MARVQNFFHTANPLDEIGASLATALFGDPQAAVKQAQARAEMDERAARAEAARAQAGLYTSQATGQDTQNTAALGLPELMARLAPAPVPIVEPKPAPRVATWGPPQPVNPPQPDSTASLPVTAPVLPAPVVESRIRRSRSPPRQRIPFARRCQPWSLQWRKCRATR